MSKSKPPPAQQQQKQQASDQDGDLDLFAKNLTKSFKHLLDTYAKLSLDKSYVKYLDKYVLKLKKLCKSKKPMLESLFEKYLIIQSLIEIQIKLYDGQVGSVDDQQQQQQQQEERSVLGLRQTLMSCLADLCYYAKLRLQFGVDENLDGLLKALSNEVSGDVWSRICRFCGNLCQDSLNIRCIVKNEDFLVSLMRCLEKADYENMDLYFCLIRFIRYGCEKAEFRNQIIDKRIFVHICKFICKNRSTLLAKHTCLIKQHLFILDTFEQKNHEYSTQLIESDTIDYLLDLHMTTSDQTTKIQAFNLIFRLCKDYDTCRAEVGRVNGIKRLIDLIKANDQDRLKYIDILCLICKEAINRFRFKEQSLLSELKALLTYSLCSNLKQKLINTICLFAHDQDSLTFFLQNSIIDYFVDYLNEQIEGNAVNGGADEPSDVNIFSNEYYEKCFDRVDKCSHGSCVLAKTFQLCELFRSDTCESQFYEFCGNGVKRKLNVNQGSGAGGVNEQVHRCSSAQQFYSIQQQQQQQQQTKRAKYSLSPQLFYTSQLSSQSVYQFQSIEQDSTSPTYSFSPLSQNESLSGLSPTLPTYSPVSYYMSTSSSPANTIRTTSPLMFEQVDDFASTSSTVKSIQYSPAISLTDITTAAATTSSNTNVSTSSTIVAHANLNDTSSTFNDLNDSKIFDNKNIEIVNHTEACIFYVFSLLSYGQQPSSYILNEKFFKFLLNYIKTPLKYNKNPRALRILNRLTKNPQCFQYFLTNQFSYKIKYEFCQLFTVNDMNKKCKNLNKQLNQMETYLNSNKVFFADTNNCSPNLTTVELQLNNNLKLHCLTSSDICYQNLLNLIKYGTKRERQSCALQLPFILRNSKALETIMLQLNCIDLILDLVFTAHHIGDEPDDTMTIAFNEDFYKALLCVKKLINFINYKQNRKYLNENFEKYKLRLDRKEDTKPLVNIDGSSNSSSSCSSNGEADCEYDIEFLIEDQNNGDELKALKANRLVLTKKSEYFNILLNGQFAESVTNSKQIKLNDISHYTCLKCLFDVIQCSNLTSTCLTFQMCLNLIELCERFMLFDIKLTLCAFISVNYLSKCTFLECWTIACKFNCKYLLNACLDFFLTLNNGDTATVDDDVNDVDMVENGGVRDDRLNKHEAVFIEYCYLFKKILFISNEYSYLDYLKDTFKCALCDIIKFNTWKF